MWKKGMAVLCILLVMLASAACGAPEPAEIAQPSAGAAPSVSSLIVEPGSAEESSLSPEDQEDVEICNAIFDWIYGTDDALNEDMEWIVLNTGKLTHLSAAAKDAFLAAVETTGYPVREGTYQQLVEEGLIDETKGSYFEKGILITLSFERTKDGAVAFAADKFRSSLGAVGTNEGRLVERDGKWVLADSDMPVYIS